MLPHTHTYNVVEDTVTAAINYYHCQLNSNIDNH